MRGREFLMKDAYSFDIDEAAARRSYNKMFVAYLRTFARMGLKAIPMRAETGPIGGDLSHEFIVLAETGESGVYCDSDVLDLPVPGEETDYDGDLTPVIRQWTEAYAATRMSTTHSVSNAKCPRTDKSIRAASRSARSSTSAPNIGFDEGNVAAPMARRCRSMAAPMASACRGWSARSSRPAMTTLGSNGRKPWRNSPSRS